MFQENLLENIKTQTIVVNASHWLLKTTVYVKCFESASNAKIKLTLITEKNILSNDQDCCNEICDQNEMRISIKLYVLKVILQKYFYIDRSADNHYYIYKHF